MNNCQAYDIKKDLKLEITETKKSVFSSTKKYLLKTITVEDMEEWVGHIKRIMQANGNQ